MISELPEEQQLTAGRLTKNSIWSVLGWAAIFGLSFISTPILVRMLGKDNYGLMTLLYTVLTPLGVLDFGVSEATVKYVSESLGRGDLHQVEKYISSTMVFNLGIGLLGLTTIALLADLLSTRVFNIPPDSQATARMCWYLIGASWFFMQTRQTFIGAVSAAQRYDILNIGNFLFQGIYILAGLSVLFLRGNLLTSSGPRHLLVSLRFLHGSWRLAAFIRVYASFPRFEKEAFRRTFGYGFWQMLNNLGGILSNQTQRWILASCSQ